MLIAPCDPERYQGLGVEDGTPSCRENLELAMRELGHDRICLPASINLFMNIPVAGDGGARLGSGADGRGRLDHVRAAMDCIVVASACPQDIVPINDRNPTSIAIELLDGD